MKIRVASPESVLIHINHGLYFPSHQQYLIHFHLRNALIKTAEPG